MKKEILIFIIILFMCIGAILGIYCYNKLNKTSYCLNLPVNVDNEIKIDFEFKESGTSTVFVYKKKQTANML